MRLLLLGLAALAGLAPQDESPRRPPKKELRILKDDLKPGACAEYYFLGSEIKKVGEAIPTGRKADVCRIDPQINFEAEGCWEFRDLQSREFFAAAWTGVLRIPKTGKYTFYLNSDDGSKLYLDGKELIDNDGTHGMDEDSKAVDLTAGDHPFRVEYFQNRDKAGCVLSWKHDGVDKQAVPATVYWHEFNKAVDTETK
jgi:hypothetical protein